MPTNERVITRFSPSPTGFLHIGGARTALFNYLFTAKHNGIMHLRVEDTDRERSKKEYEDNIIEGLKWLKIPYVDIVHQSERGEIYSRHIQKLLDSGAVYWSEEEGDEKGKVIRFKNPGGDVVFRDIIRGEIKFNVAELGDFVIARDEQSPLYHLAAVIDDFEQKVTHVIRGEDGISNTPRQILIQEALNAPRPVYAHIPLILTPDRTKLSKRHGAISVTDYRDKGYLPEALLNYLAFLGWSPQGKEGVGDREIFSLDELVSLFDTADIQKSAAIFNTEKLNWFNRQYLKTMDKKELLADISEKLPLRDKDTLAKIISVIIDRINVLDDIKTMDAAGELDYFFERPRPTRELLRTTEHLLQITRLLELLSPDEWGTERIKNAIWDFSAEKGRSNVLWPMRAALTGKEKSPDPFTVAFVIGKEETITRLEHAASL